MTIEQTVQSMYGNLSAAYTKIAEKDGEMPENKNMQNLPATIKTIKSGGGDGTMWGTLYTTEYPDGKELTQSDYLALENTGGSLANIRLSFGSVRKDSITKFSFGSACSFTPATFLYWCPYLTEVTHTEVLKEIGNTTFCNCSSLNCPLDFSNVTTIGNSVLSGCKSFNSPVVFGDKLIKIGGSFLEANTSTTDLVGWAFNQPLRLPASLEQIGTYFLYNQQNFTSTVDVNSLPTFTNADFVLSTSSVYAKMYTEGVTITGAAALGWRSALPDRTSSPYRKLNYTTPQTTFAELKAAINSGENLPYIGTEIPDIYDGNNNPLIVAQYLDSSNNESYGGAEGVILVRKYVEPVSASFGSSVNYETARIRNFLNTTYLENCSEDLKRVISDITVPYMANSLIPITDQKWFLMGVDEVGGRYTVGDGFFWDYWKQKTGRTTSSSDSSAGLIVESRDGNAIQYWLRSKYSTQHLYVITNLGATGTVSYLLNAGVLPACFIAKDS